MTSLPDGWQVRSLGEIASVIRGVTYKKTEARSTPAVGHLPLVRATNIEAGELLLDAEMVFVPEARVQHQQRLLPGDVVVAASSGSIDVVGKSALLRREWGGTFGAFCAVIRPTAVLPQFIFLYLQSAELRRRWSAAARGTNINNLKRGDLLDTPVPVPPPAEQRRIVEILEDHLSRLDAATATLRTSLRRLELLRRLVVAEFATGALTLLKSLAVDSGYGTSVKCEVGGPGVAVVRIPNLRDGRIDLSDEKRAVDPSVDLTSAKVEAGDVLIVRTNGSKDLIGRSAVVQEGVDAAFASYLIRYRVDTGRIRPAWLHAMLGAPTLRDEIERLAASSAGQYNLSLGKLDGLMIPTPALDEQDAALAGLADFDDHCEVLRSGLDRALRRSEDLRRALLAAAFRGQLATSAVSAA